MSDKYDDIINMPHHVSQRHRPMSRADRAAQFSPFAALTGYEATLNESARVTDSRAELDEQEKQKINERLSFLHSCEKQRPRISITYFVPDERKQGGAYITENITLRRIDSYNRTVVTADGNSIAFDNIAGIDGEMFDS